MTQAKPTPGATRRLKGVLNCDPDFRRNPDLASCVNCHRPTKNPVNIWVDKTGDNYVHPDDANVFAGDTLEIVGKCCAKNKIGMEWVVSHG